MMKESIRFELEQDDLEKQMMGLGAEGLQAVKKMKIGKTNKECSICIKGFVKGEVIRMLNCKHIFHDKCIIPWFEKRSCCPNCRAEQKI